MSLDPMPPAAELLRMKQEREARRTGRQNGAPYAQAPARPTIAFPVIIRIPWSLLVSDNDKHIPNTSMLLTSRYRDAKKKIHELALAAAAGAEPVAIPLELTARVWLPREGLADVVNRAKLVHDALQKAIYTDDRWLFRAVWERAGVDVDAPRAEVTITPIVHG